MPEPKRSNTEVKMDVLYQHAADLGVTVDWSCDLAPSRHGVYLDDEQRIVLNYAMTRSQALAALAHELAHAQFGDRCSSAVTERRADEYGSTFIISAAEYAAAEDRVGPHPGALAVELGVTRRMVLAWRRWAGRRLSGGSVEL